MYQFAFSLEDFLANYWQKKPTIIKGGFKNFVDPISPDELAGLALEDDVDSRYIEIDGDKWSAKHGPLNFDNVPEDHWSFIVQAVNHWHEGAAQLVTPFRQFPAWLFDDLMISYSTPGGGVGPHIDQYDVFIIQGSGKRRWRVGDKRDDYEELHRHPALRQITGFDAIIDDEIEAGDILYIPPGFPHDGYAIETAMSFSIGFRSPKKQELLSSFADFVIEQDLGDDHYMQPDLQARAHHGEISNKDFSTLTQTMAKLLDDQTALKQWLGVYLSENRHDLDVPCEPETWTPETLQQAFADGEVAKRLGGLRAFYHEDDNTTLYIHGEVYCVSEAGQLANCLCDQETFTQENLGKDLTIWTTLTELFNHGFWYFDETFEDEE